MAKTLLCDDLWAAEEMARAVQVPRMFGNPGHHGDKIMEGQIQPKAPWDKDPTAQAVYYPPPGALEGSTIGIAKAATPPSRPVPLSQRINDKINRMQGQVEELQLIRSKLQAGKLDQLTMEDLFKLVDY